MPRLDDVCAITMGQSPDSSTYNKECNGLPFFQGNADFGESHPSVRMWCSEPSKIARENDILISVRAPIGALNIANCECCIGRGLAALTVNNDICTREYLWYALSSKIDELNSKGTGSTFKAVNKSTLSETEIPLPSLDEQRRIAATLDKVTDLISKRRQQLEKLDELVKARFVEMFGDPVNNPKHWNKIALGDRCKIVTGNTPSRTDPANYGSFIEWIKSDNINTPSMFLTEAQEYLSEVGFQKCRFVESGSLLMTCIAGSIGCIGNVAVTDRRVAFNQQINAVVPVQDNVLYLYWLMQLSKPIIHNTINMALKGILSKGQLSEMFFPFPPVELQDEFATFAEHTEKTKVTISQSLESLETLKKALMQEYFGTQI